MTKDELFSLEDSLPQASFVAAANDRYVSVKQGERMGGKFKKIAKTRKFLFEGPCQVKQVKLRLIFANWVLDFGPAL